MGRIHRYGQEKDCLILNFMAPATRAPFVAPATRAPSQGPRPNGAGRCRHLPFGIGTKALNPSVAFEGEPRNKTNPTIRLADTSGIVA